LIETVPRTVRKRCRRDFRMTVAHAPHSWEFLARAVEVGGEEGLSALGRSKETLQAYRERKHEVGDQEKEEPNDENEHRTRRNQEN